MLVFLKQIVFILKENDCISIIPKDKDDIKKIRQNFNKQRFFFYLKEFRLKGHLQEKELKKIANFFS